MDVAVGRSGNFKLLYVLYVPHGIGVLCARRTASVIELAPWCDTSMPPILLRASSQFSGMGAWLAVAGPAFILRNSHVPQRCSTAPVARPKLA